MGKETAISWCDHTFNPWWGCTKVSPACDNCYAERDAKRYSPGQPLWGTHAPRRFFGFSHWKSPTSWDAAARRAGVRRRVFCASMADVFENHPDVATSRETLFDVIRATPNLDWLLLTKRVGNIERMLPADWGDGYPNVWLGFSAVTQEELNRDVPKIVRIPAAVRFASLEPQLELLSFTDIPASRGQEPCCGGRNHPECAWCHGTGVRNRHPLDWVIQGGESGPYARPIHVDWIRLMRDECDQVNVPYHFKQWGEWISSDHLPPEQEMTSKLRAHWNGGDWSVDEGTDILHDGDHVKVGKALAGDWIDGKQWKQFPRSKPCPATNAPSNPS